MVTKTTKKNDDSKKSTPSVKKVVKKQTVKTKDSPKFDTKKNSKTPSKETITKKAVSSKTNDVGVKIETDKSKTKSSIEKDTIQYYVMEYAKSKSMKFESTSQKGIAFEKFVSVLLETTGYKIKVGETRSSGDKGVDMIVSKTKTTTDAFWGDESSTMNFIVQCKYKETGNVTPSQIRDLIGSCENMKRYKKRTPMFVTTTDYTFDAKDAAKKGSVKMISGNDLLKMYQKAKKKNVI